MCQCGSTVWVPIPHKPPPGVIVERLDGVERLDVRRFECVLSQALDGIAMGLTVLVGGKEGAGKSTLCAQLASRMARDLNGLAYWLDAEQSRVLVADLFARTRSPMDRIRRIPKRPPSGGSITWREALAAVPMDAELVVVDSLQEWANEPKEQRALLRALCDMETTAVAISHLNKKRDFAGLSANKYAVDATVEVTPDEVRVLKSRWTAAAPRAVPRTDRAAQR